MHDHKDEVETQDYVSDFYENIRFSDYYARKYQFWFFEQLVKKLRPEGLILDNGCGTGHLAEVLPGKNVIGIDISPKMVQRARRRLLEAHVASAEALPFPDDYFDTVICRSLLHHVEDPEHVLVEAYRVLKPGGRILFSDTLKNPLTSLPRELMRKHNQHFSHSHKNFSQKEIVGLVEERFFIDSISYIGFVAYTLFGFPDVLNFQKYIPFKPVIYPICLSLDRMFARIPLLQRLAANIIVVAHKSNQSKPL